MRNILLAIVSPDDALPYIDNMKRLRWHKANSAPTCRFRFVDSAELLLLTILLGFERVHDIADLSFGSKVTLLSSRVCAGSGGGGSGGGGG